MVFLGFAGRGSELVTSRAHSVSQDPVLIPAFTVTELPLDEGYLVCLMDGDNRAAGRDTPGYMLCLGGDSGYLTGVCKMECMVRTDSQSTFTAKQDATRFHPWNGSAVQALGVNPSVPTVPYNYGPFPVVRLRTQ